MSEHSSTAGDLPGDLVQDMQEFGGAPTRDRELRSRGKRTVERLLVSAAEAVREHGHQDARVDDIVERAGLSHGTFYLYYRDKDDVLQSLVRLAGRTLGCCAEDLPEDDAELGRWVAQTIDTAGRHREILRAGVALGSDEATESLVLGVTDWLTRRGEGGPNSTVARLLVLAIVDAAMTQREVEPDELAAVVLGAATAAVRQPA